MSGKWIYIRNITYIELRREPLRDPLGVEIRDRGSSPTLSEKNRLLLACVLSSSTIAGALCKINVKLT